MKYKIHQFDIVMRKFLNSLRGDIVSIIPNVKPTFQGMGATAKVDFLFIVERIR